METVSFRQIISVLIVPVIISVFASACGNAVEIPEAALGTSSVYTGVQSSSEVAARVIFHQDNFTDLSDFYTAKFTSFTCLGDVTKVYSARGADYSGSATAFSTASTVDDFQPTTLPDFLKNISVDVTNTYVPVTLTDVIQTDRCSYRGVASGPEQSFCADFDTTPAAAPAPTVAPTPTPSVTPVPTPVVLYEETGMYRVRDEHCEGQGPVFSPDPDSSKAFVGGVNIDIDRTKLGANEDLLMNITYHSEIAAVNNDWPSSTTLPNRSTALRVDLVGTNEGLETLLGVSQPRAWGYYENANTPIYLRSIATLEDPYGSLRTEQVYIPLSQNSLVDRIRLERVRGSFMIYQVDLYRLGNRAVAE